MNMNIDVFYNQEQFSDILLEVNGKEIFAHKIILASKSIYFKSMLIENKESKIILSNDNFSFEIISFVIEYLYNEKILDTLQKQSVDKLIDCLCCADFFGIDSLFDKCCLELTTKYHKCQDINIIIKILNLKTIRCGETNLNDLFESFSLKCIDQLPNNITIDLIYSLFYYGIINQKTQSCFEVLAKWYQNDKKNKNKNIDDILIKFIPISDPIRLENTIKIINKYGTNIDKIKCLLYEHIMLLKPPPIVTRNLTHIKIPITIPFKKIITSISNKQLTKINFVDLQIQFNVRFITETKKQRVLVLYIIFESSTPIPIPKQKITINILHNFNEFKIIKKTIINNADRLEQVLLSYKDASDYAMKDILNNCHILLEIELLKK